MRPGAATRAELAARIRAMEQRYRAPPAAVAVEAFPVAGLLRSGTLPAGAVTELLGQDGAGAWSLALVLARALSGPQRALVIVDDAGTFYPPGLAGWGIDWQRVLVLRPPTPVAALPAIEQALRCPAVGATVAACPQLRPRECRRLQLAAESGGGAGLVLRPESARRWASFAALRLHVAAVASAERCRRLQLTVLRCRDGVEGRTLLLEIDDATGDVRVPAGLAAATAGPAATRLAE